MSYIMHYVRISLSATNVFHHGPHPRPFVPAAAGKHKNCAPFHVFAALAEFERDLIAERTKAGLSAARARGRTGGRKRALTQKQIALAKSMKADPHNSIADICTTLKISKRTLYRYTGEPVPETSNP